MIYVPAVNCPHVSEEGFEVQRIVLGSSPDRAACAVATSSRRTASDRYAQS